MSVMIFESSTKDVINLLACSLRFLRVTNIKDVLKVM